MANPYYVQPQAGAALANNLAGLGAVLEQKRDEEAAQELAKNAQNAVLEAFRSKDPNQMAEASIMYPELSGQLDKAIGISSRDQDESAKGFLRSVVANPQAADQLYNQRISDIQARGGDASQTIQSYNDFQANPEGELLEMQMVYAAKDPKGWEAYQKMVSREKPEAATDLGKLQQDLNAGFISQAQYDQQVQSSLSPEGADKRERRINDYVSRFNMSREEAIQKVDADIRLDEQGNLISYDPISGTGSIVDVERGTKVPDRVDLKPTELKDLGYDPGKGTGMVAAAAGIFNSTLGQLPLIPVVGTTSEETAQNLRVLERDAIKALATSGRPPVVEQERILKAIPEAMNAFENPEVAKQKMLNFVDIMGDQYISDVRFAEDTSNDRKSRNDSRKRARAIEGIMRRQLTPQAADSIINAMDDAEMARSTVMDISDEEILSFDPSNLSDEEFEIYFERVNSL